MMTATYDSAAGTFTMAKGGWSNTYPIADLPKRLAFYLSQQEMFPRQAAHYQDSVDALEALTAELRAGTL